MPRGYPDYANPLYSLASRNIDFGILETMAIGISSLDGRGRVFWWENFREGIYGWKLTSSGNGSVPYIHTLQSLIPPVSARLPCGTVGGSGLSLMLRQIALSTSISMGLEFSYAWEKDAADVYGRLQYDTGGVAHLMSIQINTETGLIRHGAAGGFVDLVTLDTLDEPDRFVRFKIVGNFTTNMLERAIVGNVEYDLSAYTMGTAVPYLPGLVTVSFQATAQAAATPAVNLGHVIFTIDEP
jgi:hypothetical protein